MITLKLHIIIRQRQRKRNGKTCHHGKELFLRKEKLKSKLIIGSCIYGKLKLHKSVFLILASLCCYAGHIISQRKLSDMIHKLQVMKKKELSWVIFCLCFGLTFVVDMKVFSHTVA